MRRRLLPALAALLATGLLAAGCSSSPTTARSQTTTTASVDAYTGFSVPGPYAAGTFQYTVNGDPVVVWYPVEKSAVTGMTQYTYHLRAWVPPILRAVVPPTFPDAVLEDAYHGAPAATGSFPVVLFSHGFGGYPEQSSFLTAHLATWGMIVVAPDQQKRDLVAVIDGTAKQVEPAADVTEQLAALSYVEKLDTTAGSLLFGRVDSAKLATLGHSAGGGTAVRVAAADPAVLGWIALAGVPVALPTRSMPALLMSGSLDQTVPTKTVRQFYATVPGHKALLVMGGYGHNVFDDICTLNHAHGGIVAAVKTLGLPLPSSILTFGHDGCFPPDTYPPVAWPFIDQVVTAQLRYVFGVSSTPVGIGPQLVAAFPVAHLTYTASS